MNDKIYMEYIEETLDDCIYGRQNSIEDILTFSKQIIKAVDILHKSGVVHRDLKPDNILVQSTKSTNTS
jgi:serine/threonine protein kinase